MFDPLIEQALTGSDVYHLMGPKGVGIVDLALVFGVGIWLFKLKATG